MGNFSRRCEVFRPEADPALVLISGSIAVSPAAGPPGNVAAVGDDLVTLASGGFRGSRLPGLMALLEELLRPELRVGVLMADMVPS